MEAYASEGTAKRLAQLLRDAEAAYNTYKKHEAHPRQWPEWCAAHLLASGKLANLFLAPSEESLREESTEAG
jgi:hypothetical protein